MYGLADNLTISPSGHSSIINEIRNLEIWVFYELNEI